MALFAGFFKASIQLPQSHAISVEHDELSSPEQAPLENEPFQ
jgi:hypothetical protein